MSAAGTLSVQQQACARPTLIFVVGWFLPEVREFLFLHVCSFFEEIYLVGTVSQESIKALTTQDTRNLYFNKHDTGWAKGAQSEDHTAPPSSRTASGGRLVGGGRPQACFGSFY